MVEERSAQINVAGDRVLGTAVYLSAEELRELGVDLDTDELTYRVEDGRLLIKGGDS